MPDTPLADVGWPAVPRILRGKSGLSEVAGLRYAETTVTAPLSENLLPSPRLGRVGLIASWDDDAALDEFLASHPPAEELSSGWHVRLEPLHVYGFWSGMPDLPASGASSRRRGAGRGADDRPAPAPPRATLPPGKRPRRGRGDRRSRDAGLDRPGASARMVATFSLWRNAKGMRDYARGRLAGHTRLQPAPTERSRSITSPHSCASGRMHRREAGAGTAIRSPLSPPRLPELRQTALPGARRGSARLSAGFFLPRLVLGLADQASPVGGAEDEQDRGEAEDNRPGRHRDLRPDREGEDRGARGPRQRRNQQRLLGAGAARREGDDRRDRLHAHHQHHVADRAGDPEHLEEEPEGGEATAPADPLPGGDLAQVAARLGEDDEALPDPGPEAADVVGEEVDRRAIATSSAPVAIAKACGWSAQKEISKAGRCGSSGRLGRSPSLIA